MEGPLPGPASQIRDLRRHLHGG